MRPLRPFIVLAASTFIGCTAGNDEGTADAGGLDAGIHDDAGPTEMTEIDAGCPGRPAGPSSEICNSVDDDCDGVTDNSGGHGASTKLTTSIFGALCWDGTHDCYSRANVLCHIGTAACAGDSYSVLMSAAVGPSTEVCNGFDDDCDELTDNLWPGSSTKLGTSTFWSCGGFPGCVTATETKGQCRAGTNLCATASHEGNAPGSGGYDWAVTLPVGPSTEICNGLDDNCDGTTDEGCP